MESSLLIQLTVPMCAALLKDMCNTNKTLKWLGKTYVQSPELSRKSHGTVPPTLVIPVLEMETRGILVFPGHSAWPL